MRLPTIFYYLLTLAVASRAAAAAQGIPARPAGEAVPRVEVEGNPGAHRTDAAIAGAEKAEWFQGETNGTRFALKFNIPAGDYHLELGFAEIFWEEAGRRLFTVSSNGRTLLEHFDIFKEAGGMNRAVVKEFNVAAGASGLQLEFVATENLAKFSYILLKGGSLRQPVLILAGDLAATGADVVRVRRDLLPRAPAGFEVSVVAQDPEITFPTVVASAPPQGGAPAVLFVAEDYYNGIRNVEGEKPGLDRILRIEVDPATGRAARIAEYATGFGSIQGLCYTNHTLFVAAAPEVVALKDTDRDGRPDVREVILKDCGPAPGVFSLRHHLPSGLHRGVDGRLVLSIGDHGCTAVNRLGERVVLEGGGSLRFEQDGRNLEVFTRGLRNTFHHCENEFGEWFTRDNTNDGDGWDARLFHLVPGGDYGYPYLFKSHPDEILKPIGEYGGGSSTGCVVYQENAFPESYRGVLFAADWARKEIYSIPMTKKGASYAPAPRLFLSQEEGGLREFRPTGMLVDERGDLIVADWCHDGWGESPKSGRILRIHAKGANATPRPEIKNIESAAAALGDSSRSARDAATDWFLANRGPEAAKWANEAIRTASAAIPNTQIVHAIWIARRLLGNAAATGLAGLLNHNDESVAAQAARALGELRDPRTLEPLKTTLQKGAPFARREAAIALGSFGLDAAPALLSRLREPDPVVAYCVIQSLRKCGGFAGAVQQAGSDDDLASARGFAVIAGVVDPWIVEKIVNITKRNGQPAHVVRALDALGRVALLETPWDGIEWWGTQPRTPRPRVHRWEGSAAALGAIAELLGSDQQAVALAALAAAERSPSPDLARAVRSFMDRADEPGRRRAVRLLGQWNTPESAASLADAASRPEFDMDTRARALAQLRHATPGAVDDRIIQFVTSPDARLRAAAADALSTRESAAARAALRSLLPDADEKVALQVLEAYQRVRDAAAMPELLKRLESATDAMRQAAARAIVYNAPAAASFKTKIAEAGAAAVQDPLLREAGLRMLEACGERDRLPLLLRVAAGEPPVERSHRALALQVCAKISGDGSPAPGFDDAALDRWFDWARSNLPDFAEPARATADASRRRLGNMIKAGLSRKGDVARGRALFFDPAGPGCYKCHQISGEGEKVGPELTGIAKKYSRQFLMESVLEPSRAIKGGYEAVQFEQEGLPPVSGTVVAEDARSFEVVTGPGQKVSIAKDRIRAKTVQPVSPMPSGLTDAMQETDFSDLIEFLASLK
jgi:putative membrane-bound dehydrogenase-like protein